MRRFALHDIHLNFQNVDLSFKRISCNPPTSPTTLIDNSEAVIDKKLHHPFDIELRKFATMVSCTIICIVGDRVGQMNGFYNITIIRFIWQHVIA